MEELLWNGRALWVILVLAILFYHNCSHRKVSKGQILKLGKYESELQQSFLDRPYNLLPNWLQNGSGVLKPEGLTAFPRLQPPKASFQRVSVRGIQVSESYKPFRGPCMAQLGAEMKLCLSPKIKAWLQKCCAPTVISTGISELSFVPECHCLSPVHLWWLCGV